MVFLWCFGISLVFISFPWCLCYFLGVFGISLGVIIFPRFLFLFLGGRSGYHCCFYIASVYITPKLLAVLNSSIGDLVADWLTHSLRVVLLLTYKEQPQRPVTLKAFDQSDEKTWPGQHFDIFWNFDKFWQYRHFFTFFTFLSILQFFTNVFSIGNFDMFCQFWQSLTIEKLLTVLIILTIMTKTIPVTCDIWDTDYISDNWEPEFTTIFGTWQLIVTLDSIRNSCDVLL